MDPTGQNDTWRAAEADVRRACQLLISATPASLEESETLLEGAVARVRAELGSQAARRRTHSPPISVQSLSRQVRRAGLLLEAAADYRLQWVRRLAGMGSSYTPNGEPEGIALDGHVKVRG